jgi:hypothetical protein
MRRIACIATLLFLFLFVVAGSGAAAEPVSPAVSHAAAERGVRDCVNRNRRAAGLAPLAASRILGLQEIRESVDLVLSRSS